MGSCSVPEGKQGSEQKKGAVSRTRFSYQPRGFSAHSPAPSRPEFFSHRERDPDHQRAAATIKALHKRVASSQRRPAVAQIIGLPDSDRVEWIKIWGPPRFVAVHARHAYCVTFAMLVECSTGRTGRASSPSRTGRRSGSLRQSTRRIAGVFILPLFIADPASQCVRDRNWKSSDSQKLSGSFRKTSMHNGRTGRGSGSAEV